MKLIKKGWEWHLGALTWKKEWMKRRYFLQGNAPAHTEEHSVQLPQAVFNEWRLIFLIWTSNQKILPHGCDYSVWAALVSGKICSYIFISHSLSSFSLSFLYPQHLPFHVTFTFLFPVPSLHNQEKKEISHFLASVSIHQNSVGLHTTLLQHSPPNVPVPSKSKHTHTHSLPF
jgi:hypothetical protein